KRRQEPAAGPPVPGPSSGRTPSRSDRRCSAYSGRESFLDRFTTDIRAPIKNASVSSAPFLRAFASKQFWQGEARGGRADHDVAVARLDLDVLAVADPGGLCDLTREPDRQALP